MGKITKFNIQRNKIAESVKRSVYTKAILTAQKVVCESKTWERLKINKSYRINYFNQKLRTMQTWSKLTLARCKSSWNQDRY